MSLFGKRDQYSDAPKFVAKAETGETGQDLFGTEVFGVDAAESAAARSTRGSIPPGWVRRVVGTGGRSGRVTHETLACTGITGDATDFANTSTADVANTTGTADDLTFADS